MADKTVNVNIKYNVDTAQIQRAEAASRAAQGATDRLRKSVDDYGKAAAQANKTTQDSLKKTSHDVGTLAKDFNGLYTSIRAVVTAGLAKELVDATLNMARLSGQIDGVTRAFNKIPNATLLLNDLRKATHGTVTDLALMQKALTAQNFRIPLEKLGTLLEFAAVKAQQTGQEVNHLVDYIVSGIGYRSIKRLDDLGFTANRVKEALGGVSLQAASMGQVMDAVAKLMNEDLKKTGGFAETSATSVGNLERKWHELKATISEALTSPGLLQFYHDVVDSMKAGVDYAIGGSGRLRSIQANAAAVKEVEDFKELKMTKEVLENKQKARDVIQEEANIRQNQIFRNNEELKQIKEKHKEITDSGRWMTRQEEAQVEELIEQSKFYDYKNKLLKESIRILLEYKQTFGTDDVKGDPVVGLIDATEEAITSLKEALGAARTAEEIANINTELGILEARLKRLKEINTGADLKLFDKDGNGPAGTINSKNNEKIIKEQNRIYSDTLSKDLQKQLNEALAKIELVFTPSLPNTNNLALTELQQAFEDNRDAIINSSLDGAQFIIDETFKREVDGYSMRIKLLRDFYDEQQLLAGDNERAKKELRLKEEREVQQLERKRADREKQAIKAGIVANTALSIIKIFAGEGTYVDKIIRAAIMAGQGATQYAVASKARYYAKGEINIKGPGSETSDSIPAMLSKGESVMTAKQTREAFGILTDVRAGKLNDKILKQIVSNGGVQVGFNDERIVDAIKKQPQIPDYVDKGRQIYKVFTTQEGHKRYIRSKAI